MLRLKLAAAKTTLIHSQKSHPVMASDTLNGPTNLKVRELLKEVQLDYSPSFTKLVDDTVSAIKDAIDRIPQDLLVRLRNPSLLLFTPKSLNFSASFSSLIHNLFGTYKPLFFTGIIIIFVA